MRVLFLVQYPELAPSPRYRVYQMIPWLQENGIECDVRSLVSSAQYPSLRQKGKWVTKSWLMLRGWMSRLFSVLNAGKYDCVYLLKQSFPYGYPVFESMLARSRTPFVLDYDDAIYLHQSSKTNPILDRFRPTRYFNGVLSKVDAVIAPNQFLADHSKQYNDQVYLVPEAEDTERLVPRRRHEDGGPIRIGWVGSPSTAKYLDLVAEPLRRICERYPQVEVVTVGGHWEHPGVRTRMVPWSLEKETENFHLLDIGLMPLEDDDWCRAKSGCKLRQYMSTGVPSVASAVGYNIELVEDGKTGFLIDSNSPDDWTRRLDQLVANTQLRNDIASAARESVVQRFAIDRVGPVMRAALQDVCGHPKPKEQA